MKLEQARKDYYRRLAREEGYKSRAAYKLLEAVRKYKLIKRGEKVLDLGAAPGGWMQVASEAVGSPGLVIGVDLASIDLDLPNAHTLQADINSPALLETIRTLLPGGADVILSDISPNISGAWDLDHYKQIDLTLRSLSFCDVFLRTGGNAMFKIFEGERFGEVRKEAGRRFKTVTIMKPQASRKESSEIYLVCVGRLAVSTAATNSS